MDSVTRRQARGRVARAVIAAIVAVWGMVLASFGQLRIKRTPGEPPDFATATEVLIALAGAAIVLVAGYSAARYLASALRLAMHDQTGPARSSSAAIVVRVVGYVLTAFAVLSALEVPMGGLLLGGALTGVVVGIAAQQTLGNFFAGLVLLTVRPFSVGEHIVLRSGPLGGE
ncbi:MAG TPA: mechanosensitive ion channel family protein, partial [Actinomycetota bacterium]|nr:mechanosensitive ion channel family protein [Actinomycetota bacterium]